MKKALLLVLTLMMAICFTACGGNGDAVTTGDASEDLTPAELPVTVVSEDVTDVIPDETEVTEETDEPAVTTAPESDESEATTTTETTTAATTTTVTTTTQATTTKSTTTAATTTQATTTVDEDEEEVEILWEDGIDRDEFEAMFGIDSSGDEIDVNG
ncbi:MAG: hypothetical protein LUG49_09040 [Oscillospiraceae bacterium]|nr:hypothetical protein [Oscillospiraceae bacterium]